MLSQTGSTSTKVTARVIKSKGGHTLLIKEINIIIVWTNKCCHFHLPRVTRYSHIILLQDGKSNTFAHGCIILPHSGAYFSRSASNESLQLSCEFARRKSCSSDVQHDIGRSSNLHFLVEGRRTAALFSSRKHYISVRRAPKSFDYSLFFHNCISATEA